MRLSRDCGILRAEFRVPAELPSHAASATLHIPRNAEFLFRAPSSGSACTSFRLHDFWNDKRRALAYAPAVKVNGAAGQDINDGGLQSTCGHI